MRTPHPRRAEILDRLSQPGAPSVAVLAEETGIAAAKIYGWKQSARRKTFLAAAEPLGGHQVSVRKGRVRSPSEKQKLVQESDNLQGDALVAYVREKGVTVPELMTWKDLMLGGLERREESPRWSRPSVMIVPRQRLAHWSAWASAVSSAGSKPRTIDAEAGSKVHPRH